MNINRDNYESFFIDYLEGKLDEKLVDDFIEFLQQNPDLKEELSLFEPVSIIQEEINFSKKESLFREKYDIENEFNQAAVANLEDDISITEKAEFEKYLSTHPEKQKEAYLFSLTRLYPDESVIFSKKDKLYHKLSGKVVLLWPMRIAAVLVVALSVYLFIERSSFKIFTENQVAKVENEPEKKESTPALNKTAEKKEIQLAANKEIRKVDTKKEKPKSEPGKNLSENPEGSSGIENLVLASSREETPETLKSVTPSFYTQTPKTGLAPVNISVQETDQLVDDERLLVDIVKEKTGVDKLSFKKIAKAGLSLVASLSGEKFTYQTNTEGKVTELKYDSRILAFSIPTKNETSRK